MVPQYLIILDTALFITWMKKDLKGYYTFFLEISSFYYEKCKKKKEKRKMDKYIYTIEVNGTRNCLSILTNLLNCHRSVFFLSLSLWCMGWRWMWRKKVI